MHAGLIGGIIGTAIGIVGGIIGTYFSIRNTKTGPERSFVIRMATLMWLAGICFIALLLILPQPYNLLLFGPYGIAFPFFIRYSNKRQQELRQETK